LKTQLKDGVTAIDVSFDKDKTTTQDDFINQVIQIGAQHIYEECHSTGKPLQAIISTSAMSNYELDSFLVTAIKTTKGPKGQVAVIVTPIQITTTTDSDITEAKLDWIKKDEQVMSLLGHAIENTKRLNLQRSRPIKRYLIASLSLAKHLMTSQNP
jgi:hypothetical protein